MDQEKIGKFIGELRKEKKMTQQELADILHVTDRCIGNWEKGRRMPDVSFFKPICEVFNISINELLNGEKIKKEDINKKSEEVIIKTFDYTKKKTKRNIIILISSIILSLLIIGFLLLILFTAREMSKEEIYGVGIDTTYDKKTEEIDYAKSIKYYLIKEEEKTTGDKYFASLVIYGTEEKDNKIIVYTWVLLQSYKKVDNKLVEESGSSIPYKITLNKDINYSVDKVESPRDGSYYSKDMKKLFPRYVLNKMDNIHENGTIDRLIYNVEEQAKLYYH